MSITDRSTESTNDDGQGRPAADSVSQILNAETAEYAESTDQSVNFADTAVSAAKNQPLAFGSAPADPPGFPVHVLPGWLQRMVLATAEEYQVPADLPAVIGLAVLSACCGGRARVHIRGSWREPVNLYLFVAQESGTRKSPVFANLTHPLLETERELAERVSARITEATATREAATWQAAQAIKDAGAAKSEEQRNKAIADATAARMAADAVEIPVPPRIFADDVTPEALAGLMAQQDGRLAILSSEAGIFSIIGGRYSKEPNFELFLKAYSGEPVRVDRRGREPEYIRSACLTMGLAGQPQVISDVARIPGARGRGLLARVLYSLPREVRGYRKIITETVPDEVISEYEEHVSSLLLAMAEWSDPMLLQLSPAAVALLYAELERTEPKLRSEGGTLAGIADWASKLGGNIARIAALLHLAEHGGDGYSRPVSESTMRSAIAAGDYFLSHALAAFGLMGINPAMARATAVLKWITGKERAHFTVRDCFTGVSRSAFPSVADLDPGLKLLEEHGYIWRLPEPERTGPGRKPSPAYGVNPAVYAAETAESAEPEEESY